MNGSKFEIGDAVVITSPNRKYILGQNGRIEDMKSYRPPCTNGVSTGLKYKVRLTQTDDIIWLPSRDMGAATNED
jgi:hypothetical protein